MGWGDVRYCFAMAILVIIILLLPSVKSLSDTFLEDALIKQFVLLIPILLAYLVPLDVDVTGNITAKLCEVWSEFNIFCTLVTMATTTILNLFNPKSFAHYGGYSYKAS
jgi:hypothetical protein